MENRAELDGFAESFARAWNAHDAETLSAFYAEDADFIEAGGAVVQGRNAILAVHRDWFATVFAKSTLAVTAIRTRLIARDTALLHGVWSMRGHGNPYGEWLPVRTGTLLVIFVRRSAKWQVVLSHSTALPVRPS